MARPRKEQPNRSDGLYEVKITIGRNSNGSLIRKSFYSSISKEDAKKKAEDFKLNQKVSIITGTNYVEKQINFKQWALQWLETYKKGKVKQHTYDYTYRVNVEKYLIPYFDKSGLNDIQQVHIQSYFNDHSFLAKNTLKKHHTILKNIFDKAVHNNLCIKNPVVDIKYKSDKAECQKRAYTQAEVNKIVNLSKTIKDGQIIVIMLNTGVRRSELLGLKWSDIDFDEQTISINRTVVPDTKETVDGETKSKTSRRIIPISNDFTEYLKTLERKNDYILAGKTKYGYMSIYSFDSKYKRIMTKISQDLDIPLLTPHELRHTYGSVLRERGVDIYTISKVMGHSDISITAKIYVHNDLDVLKNSMKF